MHLFTFIYSTLCLKELKHNIIKITGISLYELILRAAKISFREICWLYPFANTWLVLAGCGNNACHAYIVATLAAYASKKVILIECNNVLTLPKETKYARNIWLKTNGTTHNYNISWPMNIDLIIDGLFGTGLKSFPSAPYSKLIMHANNYHAPIVSLDIPSGLMADTGEIPGEVIKANHTQTFITIKPGLLIGKARNVVGKLHYNDLGLQNWLNKYTPMMYCLTKDMLINWLLPRNPCSHKGHHGHLLIIGGDYGLSGSISIVGQAALRTGAGLIKILTRKQNIAPLLITQPECMVEILNKDSLIRALIWSDVVVIGPGMGQDEWGKNALNELTNYEKPMLWDADALNILALHPNKYNNRIITPHPGEAARLLNKNVHEIENNRFIAVQQLLKLYGGVVVLKGAGTLLSTMNHCTSIVNFGNAGMASGGMGDCLSGIIGGLLAQQQLSLYDSACAGCMIHSLSADYITNKKGLRGLIATDLLSTLYPFLNPDQHNKNFIM